MGEKNNFFGVKIPEGTRLSVMQMPKGFLDFIKEKNGRSYVECLEEFIGGKENYQKAIEGLEGIMKKSIPENLEKRCKYCLGESKEYADKLCNTYYLQMDTTYMLACNEFLRIVYTNKYMLNNKILAKPNS